MEKNVSWSVCCSWELCLFCLYFTAKVLMVLGCECAANDVIKICTCQFQSCQILSFATFFDAFTKSICFRVHFATGCFQVMSSVNSKCKFSKGNSNLFCSVLEREKKRKPKNKQQNQIVVHGLSRNNNGITSVIIFPESHRARNTRHQFQQTKNWREQKKFWNWAKCRLGQLFFRERVFRLWGVWNRPSGSRKSISWASRKLHHQCILRCFAFGRLRRHRFPPFTLLLNGIPLWCVLPFSHFFWIGVTNWNLKTQGCCTFFVHQYIKSTTNSHVIIVYIILSMPSTSQFTCSFVIG